ncbi:MAG: uroporphyrinogen-III synthase [Nocardioidaceae bacterium]|nr:uroporphyrinogen-III synthase [Nocardioidaceae bacterium]
MSTLGPVLAGCTILVTAQRRADELAGALERRGAVVHHAPTLGVVSDIDETALLARTREVIEHPVDTVVVTTGVGLRGWLETADAAGLREPLVAALARARLVARGPKARGAMQAAGLEATWVAESEMAAEVADRLTAEGVEGRRIVVQQHAAGDDGLERVFTASGATVLPLVVYRWGPSPDPAAVDRSVLDVARGRYDAVLFTSAPGVVAWLSAVDRLDVGTDVHRHVDGGRTTLAAVGPVTAAPLRDRRLEPLVPDRSRMGALVKGVVAELGGRDGTPTPSGRLRVRADAATLDHVALPLTPDELAVLRELDGEPGRVVDDARLSAALAGAADGAVESALDVLRDSPAGVPLVERHAGGHRLVVRAGADA